MKTFKMLDISTGHISKKDKDLLENPKCLNFTCAQYEEGFIIGLALFEYNFNQAKKDYSQFSPEFFKIIAKALAEKCTHINFDRDGEEYKEEFTKFDW